MPGEDEEWMHAPVSHVGRCILKGKINNVIYTSLVHPGPNIWIRLIPQETDDSYVKLFLDTDGKWCVEHVVGGVSMDVVETKPTVDAFITYFYSLYEQLPFYDMCVDGAIHGVPTRLF